MMLRMTDSKSSEDKMWLEERDKLLSQVIENNFSVIINPFWEITEKGNAGRDIFDTLYLRPSSEAQNVHQTHD